MDKKGKSAWEKPTRPMPGDKQYIEELDKYIKSSQLSNIEMFENFAKYIPRWSLMRFLTKYEMFKRILDVEGIIIEAGVWI